MDIFRSNVELLTEMVDFEISFNRLQRFDIDVASGRN